jgi:hypothetical protein
MPHLAASSCLAVRGGSARASGTPAMAATHGARHGARRQQIFLRRQARHPSAVRRHTHPGSEARPPHRALTRDPDIVQAATEETSQSRCHTHSAFHSRIPLYRCDTSSPMPDAMDLPHARCDAFPHVTRQVLSRLPGYLLLSPTLYPPHWTLRHSPGKNYPRRRYLPALRVGYAEYVPAIAAIPGHATITRRTSPHQNNRG